MLGEQTKGFSPVSAAGKVIDLGNEFGMSVRADGEMDVIVFDGTIDLQQTPASKSRLTTGQAVRIKPAAAQREL